MTDTLRDVLMNVLMGDAQTCTYAELDQGFFDELDKLKPPLSEPDEDMAVGAWIALTDHVLEDRRSLTEDENHLMETVFERIVMRHGYLRMLPSKATP